MDLDLIRKQVTAVVDSLPQRSQIPDSVAKRWIEGVLQIDPERAVWHAERARGIGGSEIGEILLAHFNEPSYLNDPEEIWRSKMLLDLPSQENIHMARGSRLEVLVDYLYEQCTGNRSILNTNEVQAALRKQHPAGAFIVGNPDQVTLNAKGQIVIPDFKVRSSLDWNAPLELVNICQVHWYGAILRNHLDTPIDHYALAELDIPNPLGNSIMRKLESPDISDADKMQFVKDMSLQIQNLNVPGFGIRITSFDRNEQLEADLIRVGKAFWEDHVLAGKPYVRPGTTLITDIPDEIIGRIQSLFNDVLRYKLAERVAKEKASETNKQITGLMKEYDLSSLPIKADGISHSQSKNLDLNLAAKALMAKGVEPEAIRKSATGKLDVERAEQTLNAHGLLGDAVYTYEWDRTAIKKALKEHPDLNMSDYEKLAVRAGLSTRKDDKPIIENLTENMEVHLKRFHNGVDEGDSPEDDDSIIESALRMA